MKVFFTVVLALLFSGCNAPRALYDYDQQVDFTKFRTFEVYPEMRSGLSQLDDRRLLSSVRRYLPLHGLERSSNPDLYLNIYTEEYRESSRSRLGIGVGGGGRNVGVGVSGGIPIGEDETFLRLTFDLVNAATEALVWQAVVDAQFDFDASPEVRQERFNEIVREALKGYPPGK